MVTLPDELVEEICRRVGATGFRSLGPFIAASKFTKTVVYSPSVLTTVDLSGFLVTPSMANTDAITRPFFSACVAHGNCMATPLEGLRRLAQEGPSETAFSMLSLFHPDSIYQKLVSGLFRICAGDYEEGNVLLCQMWAMVDSCEEAIVIADMVVNQIIKIGPACTGLYMNSHFYPLEEQPYCTYISCAADNVCEACLGFWYSHIIRSIC